MLVVAPKLDGIRGTDAWSRAGAPIKMYCTGAVPSRQSGEIFAEQKYEQHMPTTDLLISKAGE